MKSKMEDAKDLDQLLEQFSGAKRDMLIPIMQLVQKNEGYLSQQAMTKIAKRLGIPTAKVYGVATFYNQFRFAPTGKYHIMICRGTACHVKGSKAILEEVQRYLKINSGQTTRDGTFSLEVVSCIGACGLAPVISINGEFHTKLKVDDVKRILDSYKKGEVN